MTRRRATHEHNGFTLTELVVAIAVMGLIATVIASVVAAATRNNPIVALRTDASHTLQGVDTWLPQDVDSTPPNGFDTSPTTATGCTSNPGVNLLRMEWSEFVGGVTTRYVASYRWVAGTPDSILQRVTCFGSGADPLGNTHVMSASGPLMPMPPTWVPGQLPAIVTITRDPVSNDVNLVTFQVQSSNGVVLRVDSAPKNPSATLPPTTVAGLPAGATTVLATTTTAGSVVSTSSTTTTTLPPCVITSLAMSATSMKNTDPNGNGNSAVTTGVLADPVTITASTSGYCTGLSARAQTGAPNGELFHNFGTTDGVTYTVTFPGYPQGSSELWMDGDRSISLYSPTGGPYATVTLTVK